jgi:predicted nuclease of predicted toxin-antitoxin system
VKFLFDNDLPHPIASALRMLAQPTQHVRDIPDLGANAPDDLNLSYAGRRGFFLVTRDKAIKRTPQYRLIINEEKVGIFFVAAGKARQLTAWELAKLIVKAWDEIMRFADQNSPPFMALVQQNGRVVQFKAGR